MDRLTVTASKSWTEVRRFQGRMRRRALEERRRRANYGGLEERCSSILADRMEAGVPDIAGLSTMQAGHIGESQLPATAHASNIDQVDRHESLAQLESTDPPVPAAFFPVQTTCPNDLLAQGRSCNLGRNTAVQQLPVAAAYPHGASNSGDPTIYSSESVPSWSGQCSDPLQDRCLSPSCAMLHECSYRSLKKPIWCSNCGAKKFAYESRGFCCCNGKVVLTMQDPPEELHYLFTDAGVMGSEFRKNIRGYNTAFAFTSLCVKVDSTINDGSGPYAFRIQGQIYQKIHHLMSPDETPRFLQLYIHDTQNEISNRMAHFPNLCAALMSNIRDVLDRTNPLVKVLRTSREISDLHQYNLIINKNVTRNAGVYNMPETSQVAAVWVEGNTLDGIQERCIVLQPRSGPCYSINGTSGCYDPLQYPLLFPFGEGGWQTDLASTDQSRVRTGCKITAREYYSYKLQIRRVDKSVLLRAKRLLQQYVVDMYVKIETSRLLYLRGIQPRLRKELRRGLHDSILQGIVESSNVGMPVILPASFIGGPRDMQKRYRDAMAIVHHLGKPDIFLTITCNSSWPEIQAELYDGQRPEDRPDLCTRIFYNKLRDLMHLLVKKRYFGIVLGYVVVVEFQKRGLPHAHMLLILDRDSKPRTPEDYDALVSAEIPAVSAHQQLHTRVARHMIHGPCGHLRPSSPCMRNSRCRFHYPRIFVDRTLHGTDGYPIYRRRNRGFSVEARGCMLDSRWVVPYNPALLLMFDCHINVEICSSVAAVKYLYKYVYKGHDRVQFTVSTEANPTQVDEIRRFQEARWISAPEAIWRILGFDLYNMMPAVYNLVVHLPEEQTLFFQEGSDLQTVVNDERNEKTMLTEFFRLNCISPPNQPLLYRDMPLHYVWNKSGSFWSKRKKDYVIGRMYAVSPAEGDKYYLRLLLNHVPGPVSFDDLKIANGVTFPSFKESCVERGLLEDDRAAYLCMEEAILYQMPAALRELFSTLLLFCDPLYIRELWETFWPFMAEDFKRDGSFSNGQLKDLVLADVDKRLRNGRRKIGDYDLPIPSGNDDVNRDIGYENCSYAPGNDESCAVCVEELNGCQLLAYTTILGAIERGESGVYFVDGPAGTGKTFLYRALLYTVRTAMQGIAIATASSGIAAVNMPGGQTAHSRFKIPLKLSTTSTCNISKQSADAELFRKTVLFIWDEAPMTHRYAFEALDRTMRDIMSKNELFGGKLFVFGGDFRQVLPVIPRGCRGEIVDACLIKSYLWQSMQILPLKENMRSLSDPLFSKFVLGVGDGAEPTLTEDFISIPAALLVNDDRNSQTCVPLVDRIFPQIETLCADESWVAERAILATRNDYINEINEVVLSRFPGNEVVYHSYDSVDEDRLNLYPEEFLNTLAPGGFPLHKLRLKQGAPILLLRNLNPTEGLCNGARLICKNFGRNLIEACVASGQFAGCTVFLPRIPMMPSEDANIAFSFKRKQFPIKLAFAMTINKSQGQTIKNVGIYLPEPVFSHGQLYVALSRGVNSARTSILLAHNQPSLGVHGFTRNVVYSEVIT